LVSLGLLRQQDSDIRILDDEFKPVHRIRRIER
jgi:hypothetical protein